jgi:hypothetical protein
MTRPRLLSVGLIAVGLGLASLTPVVLAPSAAHAEGYRPEIGNPLKAANELAKKGNYSAALQELNKADAVGGKTAAENLTIETMRGSIARSAGDWDLAVKSFEAVLNSGAGGANQLAMVQVIGDILYREKKDYAKAIPWLQRYRKEGGTDPAMRSLLIDSYFQTKDYPNCVKEQLDQINGEEKGGQAAPEPQYQLLMNCYLGQKDNAAYETLLERAVQHYPKPDYWANIIHQIQIKPGFASSRLGLDLSRLKLATGNVKGGDYRELVQAALQERLPAEGKDVIDKAFAANAMGTGPDAVRDNKLKEFVTKAMTDDQAGIDAKADAAVTAKDGQAMVDLGFDYVGYGQFDKGIKLMEDGIKANSLKHPDDAKLHLALAYLHANQKPKALTELKAVGGTDGPADLARVWILVINAKPSS